MQHDADQNREDDSGKEEPFWNQARRRLTNVDHLDALSEIMDSPSSSSKAAEKLRTALATSTAAGAATEGQTCTVRCGDNLGKIGERLLGDKDRWKEIHELNLDKVPNPHRIRRGTVLRIPPK